MNGTDRHPQHTNVQQPLLARGAEKVEIEEGIKVLGKWVRTVCLIPDTSTLTAAPQRERAGLTVHRTAEEERGGEEERRGR